MMKSVVLLTFLLFLSVPSFAVVRTWDGGGADNNWATAANWVGDVAPAANDDLVFPAGAAQLSTNNNFFLLTQFRSITVDGGYTFAGNPLRLSTSLTVNSGVAAINTAISLSGGQTITTGTGATATVAILSVGGAGVTIDGTGAIGIGLISGNGAITKNGLGAGLVLSSSGYNGAITVNNGLFVIDAAIPGSAVTINNPTVSTDPLALSGVGGTGTVGTVNVIQGVLSAGSLDSPTGILSTGNLTFTANGTYAAKLGGTTPGANGHDQLNVTGSVSLGNARFAPVPWNGFAPAVGSSFRVLNNDGTDPINGTFFNLPEGATFGGALNTAFRITYTGGDGNDVVVTRVARAPFDFDGDGRTDQTVFRPSTGTWFSNLSNGGTRTTRFGISGDLITPVDFDGDNRADIAIFRNGVWWILNSFDSTVSATSFGLAGDIAVPSDFDGDGRADIAVWRPSDGVWYQQRSLGNQFFAAQFGLNGDRPVSGDFDGDGRGDIAVFRPSDGVWHFLMSETNNSYSAFRFGIATDQPCAADYDGDGTTDVCVYRATADGSQPDYYILRSSDNAVTYVSWGIPGDIPLNADFDGDGRADIAISRPSSRSWFWLRSSNGAFEAATVGNSGDLDIPAAFNY